MKTGKKIIISNKENNSKLYQIIDNFTSVVSSTLGPGGKTVIIDKGDEVPHVTKDGVTVAESIHFTDPYADNIISLLKESARKTARDVGDGTTTSTLIAGELIKLGVTGLADKEVTNKREFFDGIMTYGNRIVEYLDDSKRLIIDDNDIVKNIIKISSNNDDKIVELLGDIVDEVGTDGLINVVNSDSNETTVSLTAGALIEGNNVTYPKTYVDARILLVEGALTDVSGIRNILSSTKDSPLIIIAKEFSPSVINTVNTNNNREATDVGLIIAEGFGKNRLDILNDLALITNSTVVSTDGSTVYLLRDFSTDYLGYAKEVTIAQRESIIVPSDDILELSKNEINENIKTLKEKLDGDNKDPGYIKTIKNRLSKYTKVATIKVGGVTEAEAIETKDRVDDAICAISSAVNGGVIPGGGIVLYEGAQKLKTQLNKRDDVSRSFILGARTMLIACTKPTRRIIENADIDFRVYVDRLNIGLPEVCTIDVINNKVVDAYETGIVDPVMSSINGVMNAMSIVKTVLNSSAFVLVDGDG